jgi:quercetin dioxygenase-like cupin family protein
MNKFVMTALACAIFGVSPASATAEALVESVLSQELAGIAGKEGLMLVVTYPPGAQDVVHRHDAHVFVYVLEGSVVMQVSGRQEQTLASGQTFYEGPGDLHVVSRNASGSQPAKFVVFLVKDTGEPFFIPVN